MTGRWLTCREVAETLGVAPETILRWTRAGKLPALRLPGGALRYGTDELDEWLAGRAVGPGAGGEAPTTPPDAQPGE